MRTVDRNSCSPRPSRTSTRSAASPSRAAARPAAPAARLPGTAEGGGSSIAPAAATAPVAVLRRRRRLRRRRWRRLRPRPRSPRDVHRDLLVTAARTPRSRSARRAASPSTAATASGACAAPDPILSARADQRPAEPASIPDPGRQPTRVDDSRGRVIGSARALAISRCGGTADRGHRGTSLEERRTGRSSSARSSARPAVRRIGVALRPHLVRGDAVPPQSGARRPFDPHRLLAAPGRAEPPRLASPTGPSRRAATGRTCARCRGAIDRCCPRARAR